VLFIPALWLFALYVSPRWGALVGLVWIAGRAYYAVSYLRDAEARGPGFLIGGISALVLLIGGLIGVVAAII